MKTHKNLFEKICEFENIRLAIFNAAKGKKHKRIVQFALKNVDKIALDIQQKLLSGTWEPPKYHQAHFINDGIENKKRPIICPNLSRNKSFTTLLCRSFTQFSTANFMNFLVDLSKGVVFKPL